MGTCHGGILEVENDGVFSIHLAYFLTVFTEADIGRHCYPASSACLVFSAPTVHLTVGWRCLLEMCHVQHGYRTDVQPEWPLPTSAYYPAPNLTFLICHRLVSSKNRLGQSELYR
jgi:hypothetical protein